MTTTFQDNEAVTLADLNNIAVDLGATTFSAFSEEKFGVDELNKITADLVTSGIIRTEEYGEGDFRIGCVPTLSEGILNIGHGTIVFESGAKVYIDSADIGVTGGSYIYAYNDALTGRASLQVSETEPTEGDFVMIAYVDESGNLNDRRKYSSAKVIMPVSVPMRKYTSSAGANSSLAVEVDVGNSDFSYVFIEDLSYAGSRHVPSYENFATFSDGNVPDFDVGEYQGNVNYTVHFEKRGQYVAIWLGRTSTYQQNNVPYGTVRFGVI